MNNDITANGKFSAFPSSEQSGSDRLRALFDQSPGEEVLSLRSESTKHFKLGGGRFQAITYAEPVHYKDPASGEWQDIDNSLVETVTAAGRRVLRNRANPVQVEFPAETDGGSLVSLSHDGHTFSWRFEKEASPVQARVRSGLQLKHDRLAALARKTPAFAGRTVESINRLSCAELSNALESEQERRGQLLNLHSENTYAQVLPGVSVRYTLGSHGVKEDIILDNEVALAHAAIRLPADFRYEVSKSGELLVMEKESGETLFTMSRPFVYDAEAQDTFAVPTLTDLGDYVRLEYVLDPDFLASAVFPITIDPVVKTRTINENVNDTYIWAKNPNANYGGVYLMRCGYSYSKEAISLIQLRHLVQIKASHTILNAQLRIGATDYGTAGEIMGCYPIKTSWDETTATWNSMTPTNDTHISTDLVSYIPSTNPQFCYFDITEQYKSWYLLDDQGVSRNYGIALRQPPEINSTSNFVQWASTRYNSSLGPCFIVNYVSHAGRKSWRQYESMSAGRAGSAYVDLFNGNLVFEHADGGTTGLRMPVSISHVYNSCLSETSTLGCGKGWRLNMHQSVRKESIESVNYYVWTDGDGTEHFFKISGSQPYEDEEGMSLKLKTTSNRLTITDKSDLKLEFLLPGDANEKYLLSMTDANGNAAQLTYANNRLAKIADGAGREITFTYDSNNNKLMGISIPGCPAIGYSYTNEQLTGVRYGDINGENNTVDNTVYAYDDTSSMLVSATNYDGLQVRMSYEDAAEYDTAAIDNFAQQARRVLSMETLNAVQTGAGVCYGAKQLFTYEHMTTKVTAVAQVPEGNTTNDAGKTLTYVFNGGGNVVCTYDELGYAQSATFSASVANQQTGASRLKKVVVNLLKNIDFASGWTTTKGSTGDTVAKDTTNRCLGLQSVKITKTAAAETKHVQTVPVPAAGKYTFSAFVKNTAALTSGGLFLRLRIGGSVYESRPVTGTTAVFNTDSAADGWDRLYVTGEATQAGSATVELVSTAPGGNAWFACPQLERGTIANHVNLLVNGDFSRVETSGSQTFAVSWERLSGISTNALNGVVTNANAGMPEGLEGNAMRVKCFCNTGAATQQQTINVKGSKNDIFVFGGWVNATSVASGDTHFKPALVTKFKNTSGSWSKWQYHEFDAQRVGWKYGEWAIAAPSDYTAMLAGFTYSHNTGTAMFAELFVHREQYGDSFAYDDKKNLTSVASLSGKQSAVQYDAADNVKSYRQPGAASTVKYTLSYGDTETEQRKHLLRTSVTPMAVRDVYTYDSHGNRLTSTRQKSGEVAFIKSETTYTGNGNYVVTQKDARAKIVTQVVNETDGTLSSVTDPAGKTVMYTYDAAKRVTGVRAELGDNTYRNAYTYENDRIKTVGHNTTHNDEIDVQYTFGYDALGRKTTVTVGNPLSSQQTPQTLSTNVYKDDRSGLLSEVNYGNGGKVKYVYDDFDRLIGVRYDTETADRYSYEYGANGEASVVRDHHLGRVLQTQYDLTERPMGTQLWEENAQQPSQPTLLYRTELDYDGQNRLAGFGEIAGTERHKTSYTYDNDNRTTKVTYDDANHKVEYTYDSLGRISQRKATNGTAYTTTYGYAAGHDENSTTGLVSGITQGSGVNAMNFAYTYDDRGNIASETRNGVTTSYVYDALGQLIRVNDPNDHTVGDSGTTWYYNYDCGGNITRKRAYVYSTTPLDGTLLRKNYNYTYWADPENEQDHRWKDILTKCTETAFDENGVLIPGSGVTLFEHDPIGNMTSDGAWTFEWEAGRKLKRMEKEDSQHRRTVIEFSYDHNGLRTQKVVSEYDASQQLVRLSTTSYTLHGKLVTHMTKHIVEGNNENTDELHFFYDANSRPAMVKYNGALYTYVHNLQGDIVAILDNNSVKVVEYKYDAWGKLLATTGGMADTLGKANSVRYRGYQYDEETGLYYLTTRYYNSVWQRFLSCDQYLGKLFILLAHNVFSYSINNPTNRIDHSGCIAMAIAIPIWELTEYVAVLALCAIESVFRWHVVHKNISSKTIVKPNDERDYFKDVISKINWDVDDNKKNHILHGTGSRGGHDWTKFNIDPNDPKAWWKLVPLFEEALKSPDSVTAEPTVSGDMIIRFYKYFQEYEWGIGVNVFSNYPFTYQLSDAFPLK